MTNHTPDDGDSLPHGLVGEDLAFINAAVINLIKQGCLKVGKHRHNTPQGRQTTITLQMYYYGAWLTFAAYTPEQPNPQHSPSHKGHA